MTDEDKRKLIEFKDDDSDIIRGIKAELQMVADMTPEEKQVFFQEQRVASENHQLQYMIEQNQRDEVYAQSFIRQAKMYMEDYTSIGEPGEATSEQWVTDAELCAEIAKGTRANRYTMSDIRNQREKIQWERKKLSKMTKPPTESSPSSSLSKT